MKLLVTAVVLLVVGVVVAACRSRAKRLVDTSTSALPPASQTSSNSYGRDLGFANAPSDSLAAPEDDDDDKYWRRYYR